MEEEGGFEVHGRGGLLGALDAVCGYDDGWMGGLERMVLVCKVRDWVLALVWYGIGIFDQLEWWTFVFVSRLLFLLSVTCDLYYPPSLLFRSIRDSYLFSVAFSYPTLPYLIPWTDP